MDIEGHHEVQILLRYSVVAVLHFSFAFLIACDEYKAGWRRGVRGSEMCWVCSSAGFAAVWGSEQCGFLRGAGFAVQWDHRRNSCSNSGLVFAHRAAWLSVPRQEGKEQSGQRVAVPGLCVWLAGGMGWCWQGLLGLAGGSGRMSSTLNI